MITQASYLLKNHTCDRPKKTENCILIGLSYLKLFKLELA